MNGNKKVCLICGGTGIDSAKAVLHEETHHETALFYCDCWCGWLAKQRNESTMKVREIPLTEVGEPWGSRDTGNFGRSDGGFFEYIGVEVTVPNGREVAKWNQPMKREMGPGAIAIVVNNRNEKILVTTRIEPGNPEKFGHLLLGPTLQASKGNLDQIHEGKRPPYAELLDERIIEWAELYQDGGRDKDKLNYGAIIRIDKESDAQTLPNARWFSVKEIAQATKKGYINEHLAQIMWLLTCENMMR